MPSKMFPDPCKCKADSVNCTDIADVSFDRKLARNDKLLEVEETKLVSGGAFITRYLFQV